jgi:PAS domain S-box-containing protein
MSDQALRDFWIGRNGIPSPNKPDNPKRKRVVQMLWAEGTTESGSSGTVWWVAGIASPFLIMAGAAVMKLWDRIKEGRKDTIAEWQHIAEKAQENTDKLRVEFDEHKKEYEKDKDRLMIKVDKLTEDSHKCQLEKTKLEGTLALMQDTLRRLQVKGGDESPVTVVPATVVCDLDGIACVASPNITSLLHWLPEDIVGQNVNKMIPELSRAKHEAGMASIKQTGKMPWTSKVIITKALTKEGDEVPVSIALKGWPTRSGEWLMSGEITVLPDPDSQQSITIRPTTPTTQTTR